MNRRIKILLATSLLAASLTTAAAPTVEQRPQFDQAIFAYQQQDYRRAHELFLPLAQQGYAAAQHNLGVMYEKGQGVPQDYARARYWFEQAAVQGVSVLQYDPEIIFYQNRYGVGRDFSRACHWYGKAAAQGFAVAQYNFGICYEKGQGMPQNYAYSRDWY